METLKTMNSLQQLLDDNGKRQSELAVAAGLSKETINRICNNYTQGTRATQTKIINGLNKLTGKTYAKQDVFPSAEIGTLTPLD
jgi:transcriptional regulator with XRE-family HTH domain